MSSTPIFCDTRVSVRNLWDHLEARIPFDEFLADYPTVNWEQPVAVAEFAVRALLGESCERLTS